MGPGTIDTPAGVIGDEGTRFHAYFQGIFAEKGGHYLDLTHITAKTTVIGLENGPAAKGILG